VRSYTATRVDSRGNDAIGIVVEHADSHGSCTVIHAGHGHFFYQN
jgi:hypothetical protein